MGFFELVSTWTALHVILLIVVGLVWSWPWVVVVEQKRVVIIERLGKFHCVLTEGIHLLIPGVDKIRPIVWREFDPFVPGQARNKQRTCTQTMEQAIDLRERIIEFPNQSVITSDNVQLFMHPMVLYKVTDPVKVAYEVRGASMGGGCGVRCRRGGENGGGGGEAMSR
jgi:regulator of protease activity HflC (stomatin/prohibitin superfamily)